MKYDFDIEHIAGVKILKVHNSLAGHAGLDKCRDRLKSSNVQWKYMREHVKRNTLSNRVHVVRK